MNEIAYKSDYVLATEGSGAVPEAVNASGGVGSVAILLSYIALAKRWKWLLAGSIAVGAILGLLVTLLMTPMYTASATVEIARESNRVVNVQGVEPEANSVDLEFYQTQYGLLMSETLAQRVATDLRFYDDPVFFDMFGATEWAERLREGASGGAAASRNERIRAAAEILLRNTEIEPQRLSRLVEVHFTSPDADFSARVVNAWTRLFIEATLERRFEATSYAREFLEERLEQLRERLQESERALVNYASNQRIINIPAGTGPDGTIERSIVAEDLEALNRELNSAIGLRLAAQSRLRSASDSSAEALSNQTISELRTRRASLAGERAAMLAQFEPEYPLAIALADQIAEIDQAIAREENRVSSTLRSSYDAAVTREGMLRQHVADLESNLLDLRRRTIQYNIFEREVDTNRQLYDALLQRYKEIGVAGGVGVNNISVVDPAQAPEAPSSPRLILNLLIAIMAGAGMGVVLALLLDQSDEAISDPRKLETGLGLPLLGTIPKVKDEDPVEQLEDPKSSIVESYLSAQTRLSFSTDHGVPRTLMVTSTRAGEGKSTTAYALARTLARSSQRVILVDGDMRSPSQHQFFGTGNSKGLSNYLAGSARLDSLTTSFPERGMTLLTAGPTPPNAAELLSGMRLAQLIAELVASYDHVIIDAPPVMGLADAPLIGSKVEGCVFVVESHETRATMAEVAVRRLRDSRVRLFGGLLTKFDTGKSGYGYGYDYGYGYGMADASPS